MPSYDQDESIYNLIPRAQVIPPKQPRHESKFKATVKKEHEQTKGSHRTMGYLKEPVHKPDDFLKAHQKEFTHQFPNPPRPHRGDTPPGEPAQRKPAVPKHNEQPLLGLKTNKNFISQNAVDTIMTVPRKPEKNIVDTRKGQKFSLEPSGKTPVYVKKKNFGSIPNYIVERKNESAKAKEEYEAYMNEYFKKGALRSMTDEERDAILNGLKQNWDELHHKFQALSVITDTVPKRLKKENLENEMKLLEKDIELLQRHQLIYIAD